MARGKSTVETVGDFVWRDVARLRADIEEVQLALEYDAHRPEVKIARKALYRLAAQAARIGDKLEKVTPLPEPGHEPL